MSANDRLSSAEADEASRLLVRAFARDPVITHFLSDPVRRSIAFPAFFRTALAEAIPLGHVHALRVEGRLAGVAAWFPPNAPDPDLDTLAEIDSFKAVVQEQFPTTASDLFDGFAALGELHPEAPHWYLAFVGIEPDLQGRGLGAQLLSRALRLADETATACYLETPFPETHAFYERLAFQPIREVAAFRGAPPVWTFLREPRSIGEVGVAGETAP